MKFLPWMILLAAMAILPACGRDMDDIIQNEPCVKGVVESVSEESITIRVNPGEEAAASSDLISVSLNVENKDSVTHFYVGDEVAVYYDGAIAESYPAQIHTVYAIVLLSRSSQPEEGETESEAQDNSYTSITPQEAKERMEENPDAVILDVREQSEYEQEHIPGAVLLPVGEIDADSAAAVLPHQDVMILVYCRSGNRSKTASQALADLGYTQVYEFGGIRDWPYDVES